MPVAATAYLDAEQAAGVQEGFVVDCYWEEAAASSATRASSSTAYWEEAASSSATRPSPSAANLDATAYWNAQPLTPTSAADKIPPWDRWEAPVLEEPAGHRMLPQPKRGGLQPKPKWSLAKHKTEAAENLMAFPNMKSKPTDTDEFKRVVSARSADDRKRVREWEGDSGRPWDTRGPRGP